MRNDEIINDPIVVSYGEPDVHRKIDGIIKDKMTWNSRRFRKPDDQPEKKKISMYLDVRVIDYFKGLGRKAYQTAINDVLVRYMQEDIIRVELEKAMNDVFVDLLKQNRPLLISLVKGKNE